MSFRDAAKAARDAALGVLGADRLDMRPSKLAIVSRAWAGGRIGDGAATDTTLVDVAQRFRVRTVRMAEVAASGGRLEAGDVKVSGITAAFNTGTTTGGYAPAALAPTAARGTEIVYVLTGPMAGDYRLVEIDTSRPLSYSLTLRRSRTTPLASATATP